MTRLRAALAVLAAALALGGPAVAAPPTPAELFSGDLHLSVQDDRLPVAPLGELEGRLDRLAATGVAMTRVDVLWDEIAPRRPDDPADHRDPAYRWDRYDVLADGLAARDIAVIFNVYHAPGWANGGRTNSWAPELPAYAAFLTALARRYGGASPDRDGRVHARVSMFEPWNEPNLPFFLKPQWTVGEDGVAVPASPRIYAGLVRAAHEAVKAEQPDAAIIGVSGGPNGSNNPPTGSMGIVTFVRELVRLAPPMDAYAQHLYPGAAPGVSTAMPSFRRIPDLLAELDPLAPGAPLLLTEVGYTTVPTIYRRASVSEAQQAEYLPQIVEQVRGQPRVAATVWFNLQDNAGWTAGLLREDGTPKPAWEVFGAMPKLVRRGPEPAPEPVPPPVEPPPPAPASAPPPATPAPPPATPAPPAPALVAFLGRPAAPAVRAARRAAAASLACRRARARLRAARGARDRSVAARALRRRCARRAAPVAQPGLVRGDGRSGGAPLRRWAPGPGARPPASP